MKFEKMMESFREKINMKQEVRDTSYFSENELYIRIGTFGVIVTSIFWIVYNMVTNNITLGSIGFTCVIIQFITALAFFLISFTQASKTKKLMYIITFVYDILLIVTTTMLVVEKNIQLASSVGENKVVRTGIPLVAFYYLLITIIPLPKIRYSIPIVILLILSAIIPIWFEGHEVYSIVDNMLLRIYTIALYYIFYYINYNILRERIKREELTNEITNASLEDTLTGALNKRALYELTNKISFDRNIRTIGTVIFDIDDFKNYNDLYGHRMGDDCLEKVCEVVVNVLKEYELYLFRYGGEEFVFYMINPSNEKIIEVATKVKRAIYDANIFREDIESKRITVTCGAAIQETMQEKNLDYVMKADQELYKGKNKGKNCLVVDDKTYR